MATSLHHVVAALRAVTSELAHLRERLDALEAQAARRHEHVSNVLADLQDSAQIFGADEPPTDSRR